MQKLEKAFAIGSVMAAFALGGMLYVLHPNGFSAYSTNTSANQTSYTTEADQTLMAENNVTSKVPGDPSVPRIPTLPKPSDGEGGY